MKFKSSQLVRILGCSQSIEDKWIDPINSACEKFGIDTKLRLAAFIAQVGHESARLSAVTENLNYSATALLSSWPSRFDDTLAKASARNPEKIANIAYSNRMGNGPVDSGDGWTYRGRGLIQCTGKSNYDAFSQACGIDAVNNPDSLALPTNAALSAAWFWSANGLNSYADRGNFLAITKKVNGGTNGQSDRELLYKKALIVLSDQEPPEDDILAKKPLEVSPDSTAPASSEKTPSAQNTTIVEPKSVQGDTSKYPWNLVYESRSGHVTEIDDTPGNERLNMSHRTGTYWEVDSQGTISHKSILDAYKLTKEDSYEYTGGNYTQQTNGQSYNRIGGNVVYKVGGEFYIDSPRVQMNTGTLAVSGEIISPSIRADIFTSPFADTLAKVAMVAWDLGGGSGGDGVGGSASQGTPVINSSLGFSGTPATDSLRSNTLYNKKPDGTPVITNGIVNVVESGISVAGAALSLANLLKNNDTDPKIANAMTSAAADIDGATSDKSTATPVFVKHVSFDQPTLFSQSTLADLPDASLYTNNYHTIVDVNGVGMLYMSNGEQWIAVGLDASKPYVDSSVAVVQNHINDEITARTNAIVAEALARTNAILDEATERQAAVTAESDSRQTADDSLSDRIVELTASVDGNAAAILNEQTVRADAITAEANARVLLAATVDDNTAAITTEQTARANADTALSERIDTVVATADGNTAAITTEQTARVSDVNNIKAQWAIKTDVDGHVSGIALVSDLIDGNPVSKFSVNADQFEIVNSSSGARMVLTNELLQVFDASGVLRVKLGIWT